MASPMIRLLVLATAVLSMIGCGLGDRHQVSTASDEVVCLKRADLRLVVAALIRDVPNMQAALNSGADANAVVEGLGPAIVISSLVDSSGAVQLLLDKGANINASDAHGYTALINAALMNHRDMVRLLISRGADVNTASDLVIDGKKTKFTALRLARVKGHQDIVKLLTAAGARQ